MGTKKPKPTNAELAILNVLWAKGPSTVKEVNQTLNAARSEKVEEIGYTTTLKLMQIMFTKGFLSREKDGRTHIYQAKISAEATQKNLVDRLVDTAFSGSAMNLVMHALGHHQASTDELEQIRALIEEKVKESKDKDPS
ncbi:MAG: BlaI/MecI/CopY family transcriptional regulator [Bacteroidota bacterium]